MSILSTLGDIVSGSLFKEVKDVVMAYYPPEASPKERADMELALMRLEMDKTVAANTAINDAENSLNKRIADLEGTASDLKAIPFFGTLVLFARGMQRPIWGYVVMWGDYMWFSGQWVLEDQQHSALWVINLLVLGFLFGERAVQNLAPLITEMIKAKKGNA